MHPSSSQLNVPHHPRHKIFPLTCVSRETRSATGCPSAGGHPPLCLPCRLAAPPSLRSQPLDSSWLDEHCTREQCSLLQPRKRKGLLSPLQAALSPERLPLQRAEPGPSLNRAPPRARPGHRAPSLHAALWPAGASTEPGWEPLS